MLVTLKDFQQEAVDKLVGNITAMVRSADDGRLTATALSAPTGAGKTVMAIAAIERLLVGDEADPRAVVLWMSDSPSLNEQTRERVNTMSDKLNDAMSFETITGKNFKDIDRLNEGHVYFLSRQMLSRTSLLSRGGEHGNGRTFRDVLDSTIENSHLVVFIDEAHRGVGSNASASDDVDRATIYESLFDGDGGRHRPLPVVVGITATPARFDESMKARGRDIASFVRIDPRDVQDSGLLKDLIDIRVPEHDSDGSLEHRWLDLACERLAESDAAWDAYCDGEHLKHVDPLLVVQVRDSISTSDIESLVRQIADRLPDLIDVKSRGSVEEAFANVFGEHRDVRTGLGTVRYIEPEMVQDSRGIRVLFAKESISTGWDCPRAEVLYSQRRRQDETYIAQLIGRMVRTPLGVRPDEGDTILDTVVCMLPNFSPEHTKAVVDYLSGRTDAIGATAVRDVEVNAVNVIWGGGRPADDPDMSMVADVWEGLKSSYIPRAPGNVFRALTDSATLMVDTGVDGDAADRTSDRFVRRLDGLIAEHPAEWARAVDLVKSAPSVEYVIDRRTGNRVKVARSNARTDARAIGMLGRKAAKLFGNDMAAAYRRIHRGDGSASIDVTLAAAARCPAVLDELRSWAINERRRMLETGASSRAFMDARDRRAWDELSGGFVGVRNMTRPSRKQVSSELPRYPKHVLALDDGMCPMRLNELEKLVVNTETDRVRTVAWYRNPSSDSPRSFGIPYQIGDEWRILHPDFLFFTRMPDGSIRPSVVDPHGGHLADALPKLNGWCDWIDAHPDAFAQVLSVSDTPNDGTRMLDLTDARVRAAVRAWGEPDAVGLYTGPLSHPYA